jgi:hypothetical protein
VTGTIMTDLWTDWDAQLVSPSTLRHGSTEPAEAAA